VGAVRSLVLDPWLAGGYLEREHGSTHRLRPARLIHLPELNFRSISSREHTEICNMIRKWMVFALSAGLLVSLGIGVKLSLADDDEEKSELGKIMDNVQKHHLDINKGVRTPSTYKKSQKDIEKKTKEMVKLIKKAKPMKDALKKAKDEKDPQKKWGELCDALVKELEKFEKVVAKSDSKGPEAKAAYRTVSRSCTDCHEVFRIDEDKF
jgi:cytochrome c556